MSLLVHFIQIEEEDPSSKRCHKNNSFLSLNRDGPAMVNSSRQEDLLRNSVAVARPA